MPTQTECSAPLPSAPFRFATLTSTPRWGGGQSKTPTTNNKRKVPNLFQDLTVQHKPSEYTSHSPLPSGRSGGTLDMPWTCPGTIEPSPNPVFDQPRLSSEGSGAKRCPGSVPWPVPRVPATLPNPTWRPKPPT